ncbi:hypothetical protein [Wenyingzhuangia marina]|uniref:Uncharacterized protein n=1 Tax=Wenyingzhuangia marina TaxID=1195760 RepID=A0A1M5VHD7_9FLAO|nr:hypothetical protein [Wenyingzhuangia marina]GGF72162.1 hypothetical protein GCM10011397_13820 [Wenyingzhuangia marina]SHH74647.1 hypothetical protein SAMN05444281_1802 [Wenyingzhuangia marina]
MRILRTSKVFGFCYADELQESEFFAKNFSVSIQENNLIFSFDFMRGLDLQKIKSNIKDYRFFEIEDVYLRNKLIEVVKENNHIKKMKLTIGEYSSYIKELKFNHKGFVIKLIA